MRTNRMWFGLAFGFAVALAPVARGEGVYDPASWVVSSNAPASYYDWFSGQPATTSQSVTGTEGMIVLSYRDTGHPFVAVPTGPEIYQFRNVATVGGTLTFDWHTVIFAAWWQVVGDVYVKNFTTGHSELISWPDWDRSGTASVEVSAGDTWGIEVHTTNYDSTGNIFGTIAIAQPRGAGCYWRGEWDATAVYRPDDVIAYGGSSYVAVAWNSGGDVPGASARWEAAGAEGVYDPACWVSSSNAPASYDDWFSGQQATTSQGVTAEAGMIVLSYRDTGHPFVAVPGGPEIYQFRNQAMVGGTLTFDWHTVIFAAWWQAVGDVYLKNFTTGHSELISWPDWDRSGTASVEVNAGDFWGIEVHTTNFDSTGNIYGIIVIAEPRAAGACWRGEWDATAVYRPDDVVRYGGSAYIAVAWNLGGDVPGASARWELRPSNVLRLGYLGAGAGTAAGVTWDTCDASGCTAWVIDHATVALTQTAAAGSVFRGWSGCSRFTPSGDCVVPMFADRSVTARFEPATYTLSLSYKGLGRGTVSGTADGAPIAWGPCGPDPKDQYATLCTADVANGARVVLTATPASGSTFRGWGVVCGGTGTCSFWMNAPKGPWATFSSP